MRIETKLNVGDYVYSTKTTWEISYRSCSFKPDGTSIPIMRKIVAIVIDKNGVKYQLSDGIHIPESAIGDYIFQTYEEADESIKHERGM